MIESRPVWVVCCRHRTHRIRFPARENAQRWVAARDPIWEIVALDGNDAAAVDDRS